MAPRLLTLLFAALVASPLGQTTQARYCLSGQACFPSSKVLSNFNATVGGQLFAERPAGAICDVHGPLYNASACKSFQANQHDAQYLTEQFGAQQYSNWETCGVNNSCYVSDGNSSIIGGTCGQGAISSYAVHALNADHVIKYVNFVKKYNLRAVIKNTGHDLKGRASGKGSFALWTHLMKNMTYHTAFTPKSCGASPSSKVFRFDAGVQWGEAYSFVESKGAMIVGGGAGSVGVAGGWIFGGGTSFLSPTYGLGVDNLLEMDIVTADGRLRTISECSDPELFFAVRGGGAGSWGVATSVAYKALPRVPIQTISAVGVMSPNSSTVKTILRLMAEITPELGRLGAASIIYVSPNSTLLLAALPGHNASQLQSAYSPLVSTARENKIAGFDSPTYRTFPSFGAFFNGDLATAIEKTGAPLLASSRLIPRTLYKNSSAIADTLYDVIQNMLSSGSDFQGLQLGSYGPTVFQRKAKTSVTPAWYESYWHVLLSTQWDQGAPASTATKAAKDIYEAGQILRRFAPSSGSYQNEGDTNEPNHQQSFWGSNYPQLLQIKKSVDPTNMFQVWQGVGWSGADDSLYSCYQQVRVPGVELD